MYVALTYIPGGGLLTGFAMRSDPKGFWGLSAHFFSSTWWCDGLPPAGRCQRAVSPLSSVASGAKEKSGLVFYYTKRNEFCVVFVCNEFHLCGIFWVAFTALTAASPAFLPLSSLFFGVCSQCIALTFPDFLVCR